MVHEPVAVRVTIFPVIVQPPDAEYVIGKPELAEAFSWNGAAPSPWVGMGRNVIVCGWAMANSTSDSAWPPGEYTLAPLLTEVGGLCGILNVTVTGGKLPPGGRES